MKNSTKKKSLNDFNLFAISILHGELENDIHASRHPISNENPKYQKSDPNNKHRPIQISSKYSCISANACIIFGITYLVKIPIHTNSPIHPHNIVSPDVPPSPPKIETIIRSHITTISCTINTQNVIFP